MTKRNTVDFRRKSYTLPQIMLCMGLIAVTFLVAVSLIHGG